MAPKERRHLMIEREEERKIKMVEEVSAQKDENFMQILHSFLSFDKEF